MSIRKILILIGLALAGGLLLIIVAVCAAPARRDLRPIMACFT